MKLASPLEYEPPRPRPSLPPGSIHFAGPPALVPAAKRWVEARPELVWLLARADLDDKAVAFLAAPNVKQLDLLRRVVQGQAERGSFAAAFETLERVRSSFLTTEAEPSQVTLKPEGEIVVYNQPSPTRPVEDSERKAAVKAGLWLIMRNAARLGDVDAFRRAAIPWQMVSEADGSNPIRDFYELEMLAGAGQVDAAIEFARAAPDLGSRVSALLSVVSGVAHVPSPLYNPLYP